VPAMALSSRSFGGGSLVFILHWNIYLVKGGEPEKFAGEGHFWLIQVYGDRKLLCLSRV